VTPQRHATFPQLSPQRATVTPTRCEGFRGGVVKFNAALLLFPDYRISSDWIPYRNVSSTPHPSKKLKARPVKNDRFTKTLLTGSIARTYSLLTVGVRRLRSPLVDIDDDHSAAADWPSLGDLGQI
jgi:hypothetical protein